MNDRKVTVDFIEEYTLKFISNDKVLTTFHGHSVDMSIGTDITTWTSRYTWDSRRGVGVIIHNDEISSPFRLEKDGNSILYGGNDVIQIYKLTN